MGSSLQEESLFQDILEFFGSLGGNLKDDYITSNTVGSGHFTAKRLLQLEDGDWSIIRSSEIVEVAPQDFGTNRKTEIKQFVLRLRNGEQATLMTEPGRPYFGIWNVMLNLVARNRSDHA